MPDESPAVGQDTTDIYWYYSEPELTRIVPREGFFFFWSDSATQHWSDAIRHVGFSIPVHTSTIPKYVFLICGKWRFNLLPSLKMDEPKII